MTKAKQLHELKRPRRHRAVAPFTCCPVCQAERLRVVAYRRRTMRFECLVCGARFSLDPFQVTDALAELNPDHESDLGFARWIWRQAALAHLAALLRKDGLSDDAIAAELARYGYRADNDGEKEEHNAS